MAEYVNGAAVGSPTREYVYSPVLSGVEGGSTLLATIQGGTTTYHHQDHLSVRVNTNTSGTVVGQQGHYPFGQLWYASGTSTKWQFTRSTRCAPRLGSGQARSGQASYERDAESTLHYAIFRYDSSRLGRFLTPDPMAGSLTDPQSLNRYAYVLNDPTNLTDALGLDPPPPGCARICVDDKCEIRCPPRPFPDPTLPNPSGCWDFMLNGVSIGGNCDPLLLGDIDISLPDLSNLPGGLGPGGGNLGIRAPNQTFGQCMEQNATSYSFAGLLDLTAGGNGNISENLFFQAAIGNTFTSLYYSFTGSNTAFNQLSTIGGSTPSVLSGGMGSPLTYGRRTADVIAMNLAGKTGPSPQGLISGSSAVKGAIAAFGAFKVAADASFTVAEALGCLGPR